MNNKIILASLSLDLKRVALGLHRGSFTVAKRFSEEALKRKEEVNYNQVKPYIKDALQKLPAVLSQKDSRLTAENILMYSTLFQNYTQTIK